MPSKTVLLLAAAQAAHEANRAWCQAHDDLSQPTWADAPRWQVDSAIAGVEAIVADPSITPEGLHASWLAAKEAGGWSYGERKDADLKQHPCMVPYSALPAHQRAKDAVFGGVARAVLRAGGLIR